MRRTSLISCAALSASGAATDLQRVLRSIEEHAKVQESSMNVLRSDMKALETNMKADIKALETNIRANFKGDMRGLENSIKTQLKALENSIKTDLKADMRAFENSIKADTQAWHRMNERTMQLSCVVGFLGFIFAYTSQQPMQTAADRADVRSQIKAELLSGAMSGEVFAENAKQRSARRSEADTLAK